MAKTRQKNKKCDYRKPLCVVYHFITGGAEFYHDFVAAHRTALLHEESAPYNEYLPDEQLYIDERYNIMLPQYGNILIELEPLPKSLYILFLRHPEGILLKNIANYRSELEAIYRKVSNRQNPSVISRLVEEITNPTNNMIHKNLSIIRAAFRKKLPAGDAETYIPIRNRGHRQYVPIECSMIKLPENLISKFNL